jgi:hypothetical protein
MITTTHAILNTTLLGSKKHPERNWPIIMGSILPDAPMFLYFFMLILLRHPLGSGADEFHFRQLWVDWFHSIPLAATGFLICCLLKYGQGLYFFAAMVLHDLEDLPLHSVIVHRHFLPFSNYVFHSPISYWEPDHHAALVAPIEWLVVILCVAILWRRGLKPGTQVLLIFVVIFQAVMLLYTLGFHWWLF